jgi:hypothetical protein
VGPLVVPNNGTPSKSTGVPSISPQVVNGEASGAGDGVMLTNP